MMSLTIVLKELQNEGAARREMKFFVLACMKKLGTVNTINNMSMHVRSAQAPRPWVDKFKIKTSAKLNSNVPS